MRLRIAAGVRHSTGRLRTYDGSVRYPTELADSATLLTSSIDLGPRGNEAVKMLTGHGLRTSVGLDLDTIKLLLAVTGEEHIVEYCPTDQRRFADVDACRAWVSKHRSFVAITDATSSALLAYGWSGPDTNKHVPGADITTAYRVSRAGQAMTKHIRESGDASFRLGIQLGELVIATATNMYGGASDQVSLETWASNSAARHLYGLLGFEQLDSAPNEPATRPTLAPTRVVDDERCFYVLRNYS